MDCTHCCLLVLVQLGTLLGDSQWGIKTKPCTHMWWHYFTHSCRANVAVTHNCLALGNCSSSELVQILLRQRCMGCLRSSAGVPAKPGPVAHSCCSQTVYQPGNNNNIMAQGQVMSPYCAITTMWRLLLYFICNIFFHILYIHALHHHLTATQLHFHSFWYGIFLCQRVYSHYKNYKNHLSICHHSLIKFINLLISKSFLCLLVWPFGPFRASLTRPHWYEPIWQWSLEHFFLKCISFRILLCYVLS